MSHMKHFKAFSVFLALLLCIATPNISVLALDTVVPASAVYGDTLADITLPDGLMWKIENPETVSVGDVGLHYFTATDSVNSIEIPVNVFPAYISAVSVKTAGNQYYTGNPIEPDVEAFFKGVKLKKDTDYTLSYTDNTNVGIAKVIIEGIGNFKGKTTVTFSVLKVDVSGVSLDCHEAELPPGQTLSLTANVFPANATFKNVTWTSSDNSIASVDEHGVVKARSNGVATIWVETNDGKLSDFCTINVVTHVESVLITTGTVVMRYKDTYNLKTLLMPVSATDQRIIWTSSNEEVVLVNENGQLSAVGKGVATITAMTVDGELIDTCEVKVVYSWWQCILWLLFGCIWYF